MGTDLIERSRVNALLDAYEGLLTPKQKRILDSYYRFDLSLSEIAESESITRAAVLDCLKKAKAKLEETDAALGLLMEHTLYKKMIEEAKAIEDKDERLKAYEKIGEDYIHGV